MKRKRIVVICPGRGSYTADTLGFLKPSPDLKRIDELRVQDGWPSLSELDKAEKYKVSLHTKGEHASTLIYACALQDFQSLNQDQYEIVAVTGNSMGWYLALSMAQALDLESSYQLIQSMGSMMKDQLIGGQIIYPFINEDWTFNFEEYRQILTAVTKANLKGQAFVSIELGGYLVLAGDKLGLQTLTELLPSKENYPFQLVNHGAFHTPLMNSISERAFHILGKLAWQKPQLPLIDGRGKVWHPHSTGLDQLRDYTLGHQVYAPYDFTQAITVALKEFAPDHLVLLGPGNSLGGAVGQILIRNRWQGLRSKTDFVERQKENPILISLGRQ